MKGAQLRYTILGVGAGLLLLAGTVALQVSGATGANTAAVLTFALTALLVILTVLSAPWLAKSADQRLARAAVSLARVVIDRESREQARFLARAGAPPANVNFRQSLSGYWQSDDGEHRGSLTNIANFYNTLTKGRLVILGAPGSGKTVMANQLLLDRASGLLSGQSSVQARAGIPVRLSLPDFDPLEGVNEDSAVVVERLYDWIASRLAADFRLRKKIATELVAENWVLPILDGLDEMDPDVARDVESESDSRAAILIRALNNSTRGQLPRVIVTCRTDRYRELDRPTVPGREGVLLNAATIELQPLTPEQIAAYLTARFPDTADHSQVERRWRPVVHHIVARPRSQLARTLSLPLRLFMTVTAYHLPSSHPAKLIQMSRANLETYLFDSYICAVVQQHTRKGGRSYAPEDVKRWLGFIAQQMKALQQDSDGAASDLSLDTLWRAAGARSPKILGAAVHGVFTAGLLLAIASWYTFSAAQPLRSSGGGRIGLACGAAVVALVAWRSSRTHVIVSRLDTSALRTARGLRDIASEVKPLLSIGVAATGGVAAIVVLTRLLATNREGWLAVGAIAGLALGFVALTTIEKGAGAWRTAVVLLYGVLLGVAVAFYIGERPYSSIGYELASNIVFVIAVLLIGSAIGGILSALSQRPSAIARPGELISQGCAYDLTFGLGMTCVLGATGALTGWLGWLGYGISLGSVIGFATGIGCAQLWNADSPWIRYLVSTIVLTRRHVLPARPAQFLDWAYASGLLRLSGISIQFRHRELQDWLAASNSKPNLRPWRGTVELWTALIAAAALVIAGTAALDNVGRFLVQTVTDPRGIISSVDSVAFSPDGRVLAGGDGYGSTYLWDVASGRRIATLTDPGAGSVNVSSVAFSPDGHLLAAGDADGSTYLWDLASRRRIAALADQNAGYGVDSVAFSPDGRVLAAGDEDGSTYLWDVASGRRIATLTDPSKHSRVNSVAFSPDGRVLAAGDEDGSTYLWDLASRRRTAALADKDAGYGVGSVAFSPDGHVLAAGDGDGSTYLWDLATGRRTATLTEPGLGSVGIDSVAFSPGGHLLAAGDGDGDGSTYLWNVATGRRIAAFTTPDQVGIDSVAFSPGGHLLAAGDGDGLTYLWDVATGRRVGVLADPGACESVDSVAFSPDGRVLAAGDGDGSTYLWDMASRRRIATLADKDAGYGVDSVAFSPNGHLLAAGDGDGSTYLWDVATGRRIATLTDPNKNPGVNFVAFSPGGRILAVADQDGSTYLWDVASGRRIATLTDPGAGNDGVSSVAFSPNGRELVISDGNGRSRLWHL